MKIPTKSTNKQKRIESIDSFDILDIIEIQEYDFLTSMVSYICKTQIASISLIHKNRQCLKLKNSLKIKETPKEYAFCIHSTNNPHEILLIQDLSKDKRFYDNPLIIDGLNIIFFVGIPLITKTGIHLGTLCIFDNKPNKLTSKQIKSLKLLSDHIVKLLELKKKTIEVKKNQVALKNEKLKFQNVISGLNLATWEWNMQTNEAEYNERFAQTVGYTLQELEPLSIKTWEKLAHPDDYEALRRRLDAYFEGKTEHFEIETRLKHKDGHWIWVFSMGKVFNWTSDGKPIMMYGAHMDITKRKLEEREKEYNSALLKDLFQLSPIGISLNDLETGAFIQVNNKLLEPTGYNKEEFLKLHFKDITFNEDEKAKVVTSEKWLENKLYEPFEKEYVRKDGSLYPVSGKSILINDIDGNPKIWSFIEDISRKKEAEEELKVILQVSEDQNERLKNFAHIVSHNLRSHSGNIDMLLEFLLQENPELKKYDLLDLVVNASKNLKETISHLSEVATVNTNQLQQLEPTSLTQTCLKSINNVVALAKTSSVKIINDITDDVKIYALTAYLESIVLNFLTNAIKYKSKDRESYVKLYISKEIGYVILNIEDNGLGIDLEKYGKKMFGMYKTFHKHDDARGVGLFITKNQVEAMGGYIEVESKVNVGSTFKIYFKDIEKVN